MKRSEANEILKARIEFSTEYECVSSARVDENGDRCGHSGGCECESAEEHFSRSGCDVCPEGLAATVSDVVYLAKSDTAQGIFTRIYEGSLCGGCLCSLVNGHDSDLDYYTTDEDCEELK